MRLTNWMFLVVAGVEALTRFTQDRERDFCSSHLVTDNAGILCFWLDILICGLSFHAGLF